MSMSEDIERKIDEIRATKELAGNRANMLESVFSAIPDLLYILDEEMRIVDFEVGVKSDLRLRDESSIRQKIQDVLPTRIGYKYEKNIEQCSLTGELVTFEYELHSGQATIYHEARIAKVASLNRFIVVVRDITTRKLNEDFIERQAYYDSLSGLPNRYLAMDRLDKAIERSKRNSKSCIVVFLDLDDFKTINDTQGHDIGDLVIAETSKKLSSLVRESDTVARLGGDEFLLILESLENVEGISNLLDKLIAEVGKPIFVSDTEIHYSISGGIAIYPSDAEDSKTLMRKADIAMYHSKAKGKNQYTFFSESMNKLIERRAQVERAMVGALEREEFSVLYQPQFDLMGESLIGAEALIRWQSPTLGGVSPAEFIPIAEHNGLIEKIGKFVLKEAIKTAKLFTASLSGELKVAINLSPRQLRDKDLVSFIVEQLKWYELPGTCLELEITEGVLLSNITNVQEVLGEVRKYGISISMDDFGTGYSSLHYLQEYPFDLVKIDRDFIEKIDTSARSRELVRAIVSMSHQLNIPVLAEGVETNEQLRQLTVFGCDYIQGYFMGPAVSSEEFVETWGNDRLIQEKLVWNRSSLKSGLGKN